MTYTLGTTAASASININATGAKAVRIGNAAATALGHTTTAGGSLMYRYDGTYFHLLGSQQQVDTNTLYSALTSFSASTASGTLAVNV